MKRFLLALVLVLVTAVPLYADNKAECEQWCRNNPGCEKCSEHTGCGIGYKSMKHFRGPGKDWHACQKSAFGEAGEENRKACEEWCKEPYTYCDKCSDKSGCGTGWWQIKAFTGPGKNWFACTETTWHEYSRYNRHACETWCKSNPNCVRCADHRSCDAGYEWIAQFDSTDAPGDSGKRWYACKKSDRKLNPPIDKSTCEAYCTNAWGVKICICTDRASCPSGYEHTGERFLDWRACQETAAHKVSENNHKDCRSWCDKNEKCIKCSSSRGCGIGYSAIKEFGDRRDINWFACVKR